MYEVLLKYYMLYVGRLVGIFFFAHQKLARQLTLIDDLFRQTLITRMMHYVFLKAINFKTLLTTPTC